MQKVDRITNLLNKYNEKQKRIYTKILTAKGMSQDEAIAEAQRIFGDAY